MYNIFVIYNSTLEYFQINFMKGLFEMSDFVCRNCGKCCGPVPIVEEERKKIEKYLQKHPGIREKIKGKKPSIDCIFLDSEKGCLIYPARPKICKAYRCSSKDWTNDFKPPKGTSQLINDCFGVATSTETHKSIIQNYLSSTKKK